MIFSFLPCPVFYSVERLSFRIFPLSLSLVWGDILPPIAILLNSVLDTDPHVYARFFIRIRIFLLVWIWIRAKACIFFTFQMIQSNFQKEFPKNIFSKTLDLDTYLNSCPESRSAWRLLLESGSASKWFGSETQLLKEKTFSMVKVINFLKWKDPFPHPSYILTWC